jgi:hypothetical protein
MTSEDCNRLRTLVCVLLSVVISCISGQLIESQIQTSSIVTLSRDNIDRPLEHAKQMRVQF